MVGPFEICSKEEREVILAAGVLDVNGFVIENFRRDAMATAKPNSHKRRRCLVRDISSW